MRVKRYTADNLQDAMLKVKMDMGKDAVILHTKKVKEGGWFFGLFGKTLFEVTAAIEDIIPQPVQVTTGQAAVAKAQSVHTPSTGDDGYGDIDWREEILEMKKMLNDMMNQIDASPDVKVFPKLLQKYHQILTDNDVDDKLTKRILKDIIKQLPQEEPTDCECVARLLEHQLLKILRKPKPISFKRQSLNQQSIALVGPTGVGKTTTIAKLAATFSIVDKKKVALITADTYRVAAVEQLKTYGEIIGITVDVVYTPQELHEAISQHTDKDLILIDTAGRSHKNHEQMVELRNLLEIADPSDIFLVLSATTRSNDMTDIINSYADIPITKLVFTKLDETSSFGAILNTICKTQKYLSYVTVGQNVPDDIEIADPAKIVKMIMRES